MKRAGYSGVLAAAVCAVAACSHAPQLTRHSDQTAVFRAQYLQYYAGDPFEGEIRHGIVHKTMNFMQVLAAWGLPNARTQQSWDGDETWTYFAVDEHSNSLISYDLVFTDGRVDRWVVRHPADMPILPPEDLTGLPTGRALVEDTPKEQGLSAPRKP
jgi:hypothetical protein